ncbi:hypothetical protein D9M72_601210 [compost metagenome]
MNVSVAHMPDKRNLGVKGLQQCRDCTNECGSCGDGHAGVERKHAAFANIAFRNSVPNTPELLFLAFALGNRGIVQTPGVEQIAQFAGQFFVELVRRPHFGQFDEDIPRMSAVER